LFSKIFLFGLLKITIGGKKKPSDVNVIIQVALNFVPDVFKIEISFLP